ncbi:1777_t:CDS:2 [Entrophospora sp. SA101]|nr:1777_t:CDS:2 [Entrophospora sp. SA101]
MRNSHTITRADIEWTYPTSDNSNDQRKKPNGNNTLTQDLAMNNAPNSVNSEIEIVEYTSFRLFNESVDIPTSVYFTGLTNIYPAFEGFSYSCGDIQDGLPNAEAMARECRSMLTSVAFSWVVTILFASTTFVSYKMWFERQERYEGERRVEALSEVVYKYKPKQSTLIEINEPEQNKYGIQNMVLYGLSTFTTWYVGKGIRCDLIFTDYLDPIKVNVAELAKLQCEFHITSLIFCWMNIGLSLVSLFLSIWRSIDAKNLDLYYDNTTNSNRASNVMVVDDYYGNEQYTSPTSRVGSAFFVNCHNFFANSSSSPLLYGDDSTPNGIKNFPRRFFFSISGLVAQYNVVNAPSSGVRNINFASQKIGIDHLPRLFVSFSTDSVFAFPNEMNDDFEKMLIN